MKGMSGAAVSDGGLLLADEKGYFKEEGLDVEITVLASTPDVYGPLATGQVDIAGTGPNSGFFNAIQRDIPVRIVADKGNVAPGNGFLSLVVRKDLIDSGDFKDLADLKGKTLAHASTS